MANYKTVNEILHMINRTTYPRIASQLQMLALTEFAKEIEKKGCKIVGCHPYQIKLDNGKVTRVIGSYLNYTYDEKTYFYFQFDENPFFPPMGYRKVIDNNKIYTTGLTELKHMYNGINEYNIEEENIKKLITNIYDSETYLTKLSFIQKKENVSTFIKEEKKQKIYTN